MSETKKVDRSNDVKKIVAELNKSGRATITLQNIDLFDLHFDVTLRDQKFTLADGTKYKVEKFVQQWRCGLKLAFETFAVLMSKQKRQGSVRTLGPTVKEAKDSGLDDEAYEKKRLDAQTHHLNETVKDGRYVYVAHETTIAPVETDAELVAKHKALLAILEERGINIEGLS